MRRLILHIGTHKTASTAIQNTLAENRDAFRRAGFWYARTDRPPLEHQPKHNSVFRALGEDARMVEETSILLSELEDSGCDTLVLSDEGLSSPQFERNARMRVLTQHFDEVRVICFLRRQDFFLESLWNQFCMARGEKRSLERFARSNQVRARLKYDQILEFWAEIGEVRALSFEEAKSKGVFNCFVEAAGMPLIGEVKARNVSPSMNCALLINLLNQHDLPFEKKVLIKAFAGDKRKFGLGRKLRREILDYCAPHNERLEKLYGVSFDTELPEEPDDPIRDIDPVALAKAVAVMANPVGEGMKRGRGKRRGGRSGPASGTGPRRA